MKILPIIPIFLSIFTIWSQEQIIPIPRMLVYDILQHNDSIYFSTSNSGIFRFSPRCPESVLQVGGKCRFPIRKIAFSEGGELIGSSYRTGGYFVQNDSLKPLSFARHPAWSMKFDSQGAMWLAGLYGIFRQQKDSLILFSRLSGVHDLAFFGNSIAVAHMNGISLFNKENGKKLAEYCKGIVCWSITRYDSLLVGGGFNLCVIINRDKVIQIPFGPKDNQLWATARTRNGTLYLGTQKGLFSVQPGTGKADPAGYEGICIKALFIDQRGRLWVGRF